MNNNELEKIGPEYPVLNHLGAVEKRITTNNLHEYHVGDLVSVSKVGKDILLGTDFAHLSPDDYTIGHVHEIRQERDSGFKDRFLTEVHISTPKPHDSAFSAYEMVGMQFHNIHGISSLDWGPDSGQSIWKSERSEYLGQMFGVNLVTS